MTENIVEQFRDYRSHLESIFSLGGSTFPSSFYDTLEALLTFRPLPQNLSPDLIVAGAPEHLRAFLTAKGFPFSFSAAPGEAAQALEGFIAYTKEPQWSSILEVIFLRYAAERWLDYLGSRNSRSTPCILLALCPSLDLQVLEENHTEPCKPNTVTLPILILNTDRAPACQLKLRVSRVHGAGVSLTTAEPSDDQTHLVDVCDEIRGGCALVYKLYLQLDGASTIRIEPLYLHVGLETEAGTSEGIEVLLGGANVPESPTEEGHDPSALNPFIPDLPLTSSLQWSTIAKGDHALIVNSLATDPEMSSGRAFVIRGLRRTGKTSLLRWLTWQMKAENSGLLPVYIDVYLWNLSLGEGNQRPSAEALYYELAESLVAAAQSVSADTELRTLLADVEEDMLMSLDSLEKKISRVREIVRQLPVVVIDDLDWWINHDTFREAQEVLRPLVALAARTQICSIVLSHDWTTPDWDEKYDRASVLPWRIRFLKKQDVTELIRLSPIPFTDLAVDFLWRLSGGWHGPLQLFCYHILQQAHLTNQRARLIDLSMAKRSVAYVLNSKDFDGFFQYFLRSFQPQESDLLLGLIANSSVVLDSGMILGLQFMPDSGFSLTSPNSEFESSAEALKLLAEKEIIEPFDGRGGHCRLRVGFLAYRSVFGRESDNG